MKRDMDLIRNILIGIEAYPAANGVIHLDELGLGDYPPEVVAYHVKLLDEAGLIVASDFSADDELVWLPSRLTWSGHEFLDAARHATVWEKAKHVIQQQGGALPLAVIQALLIQLAKQQIGLP